MRTRGWVGLAACWLAACGHEAGGRDAVAPVVDAVVRDALVADAARDAVGRDALVADAARDAVVRDAAPDAARDAVVRDAAPDAAPDGCVAVGAACGAGDTCCEGACEAGVCLAAHCGVAGAACGAAAACCSASCVAGHCTAAHIAAVDDDRDRLLDTLAQRTGAADRCAQWQALDAIQKGIFLTHTDMLGNRSCLENAALPLDASGNCRGDDFCRCDPGSDMALSHVLSLEAVKGSDPGCACDEGDDGYECCNGGGEWHRTFFTADDALIADWRDPRAGLPEWHPSTDFAGPHAPFTQSSETVRGSPSGQAHFWARDEDAAPLDRDGVEGLSDPHLVELDNDYNLIHDSNPEGCYGLGGLFCEYGRVRFKNSWGGVGSGARTEFRGNGEPSEHRELADDAVYAPRCPEARVAAVEGLRRGAVATIRGAGFQECPNGVGCGNEVHVRTRSAEIIVGAPFALSEAADTLRFQLPVETPSGPARVWLVVAGGLTNAVAADVAP